VDTSLEQGLSVREPQQEIIALKEEILTKSGPRYPLMSEFWAALSFGMTVFSCQHGIHLGWRRRPGLDGGLRGSSWTVDQVKELRARLWSTKTDFTSLHAETRRTEDICIATGLRVRYETLGPDSRDLILAGQPSPLENPCAAETSTNCRHGKCAHHQNCERDWFCPVSRLYQFDESLKLSNDISS
jgi:hypothetical protein